MKVFGLTHRGMVRKENQDSLRYERTEGAELLTAVLCDGMGGAKAGSLASAMAADGFMSHAANSLDESSSYTDMRSILTEAVSFANSAVYTRAFSDLNCMGMGTTLVALLVTGRRVLIGNVGDSRAYLLSKDQLRQLTRDHSLVEDMIARGKLTREQARTHPKKNIITRAVGVDPSVRADLTELRFPSDGRFLLCSDGLSNIVTEEEMLRILLEHADPGAACDSLLSRALELGAPDNVTVFIAQR